MNLTALAPTQLDKKDALNLGAPRPKSGWQLSDRLDWAMGLKGVSHNAWAVAVIIAHHAGASTGLAWPGFSLIAAESRLSRSAVIRAVAELERGGHLTIQRFKRGRVNAANRYRLPVIGSAPCAPPSVCETPPPSVCETPEPGTSEPVLVHTAPRVTCELHDRTWFERDGTDCFECARDRTRERAQPAARRMIPAGVLRQHAARSRVAWS